MHLNRYKTKTCGVSAKCMSLHESICSSRGEIHATHLPRSHLAVVAHLRVSVLLYGEHRCICGQKHRWFQTFASRITPKAWWKSEVARLIVFVPRNVTHPDLGELAAQKVWSARPVLVQLNGDASGCMTMTARIKKSHIAYLPMVGDGVRTLAIWTIWARSRARGAWCRSVKRPLPVPWDWLVLEREGRWDIVFPSIGLCLRV